MPLEEMCIKDVINQPSSCKIVHLDASPGLAAICNPFLRVSACKYSNVKISQFEAELTPDDVDPGGGRVAHTGLAGVHPGVAQAGLLHQQERGGRGAWQTELFRNTFLF